MPIGKSIFSTRQRSCRQCFAYIRADSRKCKFCGYVYKTPTKYVFDQIKRALNINRVYAVDTHHKPALFQADVLKEPVFFNHQEIEKLIEFENIRILMYLVLDDLAFLDEMSLIELGKMLMALNKTESLGS